jgi:hypothetical protein
MKCQLIVVFSPFHFFSIFPVIPVRPHFLFPPVTSPIPETFGCRKKNIFSSGFDWQYIGWVGLGNEIGTTE